MGERHAKAKPRGRRDAGAGFEDGRGYGVGRRADDPAAHRCGVHDGGTRVPAGGRQREHRAERIRRRHRRPARAARVEGQHRREVARVSRDRGVDARVGVEQAEADGRRHVAGVHARRDCSGALVPHAGLVELRVPRGRRRGGRRRARQAEPRPHVDLPPVAQLHGADDVDDDLWAIGHVVAPEQIEADGRVEAEPLVGRLRGGGNSRRG